MASSIGKVRSIMKRVSFGYAYAYNYYFFCTEFGQR